MQIKFENLDSQAKAYFESLPTAFQESIMQSGVEMTTKEQMEAFCKNVMGQKSQG